MAKITWDKVKKYLDKTYKIEVANNDFIKITFVYPDDNKRTQLVVVGHEQQKTRLVVEIASKVGNLNTKDLPAALEVIGKKYFVGLERVNDCYYTRVSVDMSYTPLSALSNVIELAGRTADTLEKDFIGGDEN